MGEELSPALAGANKGTVIIIALQVVIILLLVLVLIVKPAWTGELEQSAPEPTMTPDMSTIETNAREANEKAGRAEAAASEAADGARRMARSLSDLQIMGIRCTTA
jgi:type II secretory pathway component PulM